MIDSDVRPQDTLSLADFVSLYAFFFGPASETAVPSVGTDQILKMNNKLTLAEVAIQVLQEERWRSTADQVIGLVERLSAGRSAPTVTCITKIRDVFESIDVNSEGFIHVDKVEDIFRAVGIPSVSVQPYLEKFKERMDKVKLGQIVLPDLFEHFGIIIQETGDYTVTVSEAFAMLRFQCDAQDVRAAAETSLRVIDNMLKNQENPKYWRINVTSEVIFF
jgi:hypothetical protein